MLCWRCQCIHVQLYDCREFPTGRVWLYECATPSGTGGGGAEYAVKMEEGLSSPTVQRLQSRAEAAAQGHDVDPGGTPVPLEAAGDPLAENATGHVWRAG